jgi:tyrosyl-tRNA synthetase
MSKSTGNYVGITESPEQQFGKTMSIPDLLMPEWFASFTDVEEARVTAFLAGHPRDAKEALAKAIVGRYHGAAAADSAAAGFRSVFAEGNVPDEMPDVTLPAGPLNVVALVAAAFGPAKSKSEARRLVEQGAVSLGDERLADPKMSVEPVDGAVLKVGKKDFFRIRRA